ncbi:S-adenosyl-L-methionine-dependent methyltransferase-like [Lasallia pustulata]|uniref:S-adenosyl-L-methionine-dependent methyltransferase-like n=1 Tax=Lasallia pustulata TaxID=136370 RepID=A0A1W5D3N9_9LECA|nr:S-adenosyl-L-methionine-dependent methyltransferase-like [Lasallia pustulata]
METYLLPATTYVPPPRLARRQKLNTIIEGEHDESEEEQDECDRGRERNPVEVHSAGSSSPVPSLTSSISSYYMTRRRSRSQSREFDDLYDVSDEESEHATPSMACRPVSIHSDTSRSDSLTSSGSRNRYPSLFIPSPGQWPTIQKLQKNSLVPPSPQPKFPISPAALFSLNRDLPTSTAPPSLDGSLTSDQLASSTAPPTPDMQVNPASTGRWDRVEIRPDSFATEIETSTAPTSPDIEIRIASSERWVKEMDSPVENISVAVGKIPYLSPAAPDSPVLGQVADFWETAIELPPDALAVLQDLSPLILPESDSVIEKEPVGEMQELLPQISQPRREDMTPATETSDYSLAQLSIPSPGGFFASLEPNARHTWCMFNSEPSSAVPPSSTTAEKFYSCPWNQNPQITVERIVEIDNNDTDGPPTARQMPFKETDRHCPTATTEAEAEVQEISATKPDEEYDEDYMGGMQLTADNTLDRTSLWLTAQTSYMSALREANPLNDMGADSPLSNRCASRHGREPSPDSPMQKAVRFLESDITKREHSPPIRPEKADPIYYHAFQHVAYETSPTDVFIHRQTRFDALQASRVTLAQAHLDQLLGNYHIIDANRPVPQRPISLMPGKDAEAADLTAEQKVISRVERERQVLEQIKASTWVVEATKYLTGGRLLNSPAADVLKHAPRVASDGNGLLMRALDLGGQPTCDWAWYCARTYPNVKTYTVTAGQQPTMSKLSGPGNHRSLPVSKLWKLPFPDAHFDVISARSLFMSLRNEKPLGETTDEYDLCLLECLRCLKPGGYLEFFVIDSEAVQAGPRGTAVSVEFGFNLATRGYDPSPTKSWLGRLRRAGYTDIKRAWMFLPMGSPDAESRPVPETPPPDVSTFNEHAEAAEAVRGPVGSTADAASISGLVGGWMWEKWMLKLQMEMDKEREHLLEGVGAVYEEGRAVGAGWRCLSGWARKAPG